MTPTERTFSPLISIFDGPWGLCYTFGLPAER